MTEQAKDTGIFSLTEPVVMAFPNLLMAKAFIDPKTGKEKGEPKYSGNFIFNPDSADLKSLKALAVQIARAKWPARDLKTLVFPFVSGDKLADAAKTKGKNGEYQRGKVVVTARSKYQPRLAAWVNGKITDLEDTLLDQHKSKFYPGAQVYAQFNFVVHEVGSNTPGVNAYLNMVLTTGKGERLAGPRSAVEVFSGYAGGVSDVDPTAGQSLDDEIPF